MAYRIAYRRVSTTRQTTARQLDGEEFDREFEDKASGSSANRPELAAMIASLRAGDEVVVASIDRLARSVVDLVGLIETVNARGASLEFVKEGLTFSGKADSMQLFQLQIMGAVAEFERSIINERAAEGREAAKARGVRFGRAPVLSPKDAAEVVRLHDAGKGKSIRALALDFDVGRATITRALKRSAERDAA